MACGRSDCRANGPRASSGTSRQDRSWPPSARTRGRDCGDRIMPQVSALERWPGLARMRVADRSELSAALKQPHGLDQRSVEHWVVSNRLQGMLAGNSNWPATDCEHQLATARSNQLQS